MAQIPFGEWRPDVSDLRGNYTARLRNVLPRSDGYGPFKDIQTFTSALPAACRGYFVARKEDGSALIFAGTVNNLYLLDNTTLTWGEVSQSGSDYTDLNTDANWVFAQFNNAVIAVQKNTPPQTYDISSDTEFSDLGGSPPQAGFVSVIARFVVLTDLLDDPFRVQWSGLNEIDNWVSGVNSSDFQDLPDGGRAYCALEVADDVGFIWQAGGVRRMVFSPGSEFVFQIGRVAAAPGILSPYSAVIGPDGAYYLSTKGFGKLDATGGYVPIGEERVDRTVLGLHASNVAQDLLNLAYQSSLPRLVIGVPDPAHSLIVWVYRSILGVGDTFDRGVAYHTTIKRWSPIEVSGEYIAAVSQPGVTLEGLDAIAPGVQTITGAADNGGGKVRLTVGSTSGWTTGDVKTISGVGGTTEANVTAAIAVIDATHIDLLTIAFVHAYTSGGIVGGSIDLLDDSLDSFSTASLPNVSVVDDTHMLGFFAGDTLEAELHLPEASIDQGYRIDINGLRPITDANSAFCSVIKRENLNSADTDGDESEMDSDGNCPVLEDTRYARGKLRIPEATVWTFASGIEPETQRAGLF